MAHEQQHGQTAGAAYIIAGPRELSERCVRPGCGRSAAEAAIAAAEQAIGDLSVNFKAWMTDEVGRLDSAHRSARSDGMSARALEKVFEVAHDLKGQAGTLGYPLAGEVCASLCRLLEACSRAGTVPAILLDQHIGAVKAMLREGATGEDNGTACKLAGRLRAVTDDFIARARPVGTG